MKLWRLTKHPDLSGEGGRLYSARWHNAGLPVVYLAESAGSAFLEVLVHQEVEEDELPPTFTLLQADAPDSLAVKELFPGQDWSWKEDPDFTRKLGDDWLKAKESALARVPSALVPLGFNYLLNPLHPDANAVKIVRSVQAQFDLRFRRKHSKL